MPASVWESHSSLVDWGQKNKEDVKNFSPPYIREYKVLAEWAEALIMHDDGILNQFWIPVTNCVT